MRRSSIPVLLLLAAVTILVASPVTASQPDLSGEWTLTMEGDSPSGEEAVQISFTQDGNRLVATMAGEVGEVECEGWADGNAVRFYYVRSTDEGEFVARYTGHVAGDLMGGEVDLGEQGVTNWRATRGAAESVDLSGKWTMTMEGGSPSGMESVPISFHQEGHTLIATMSGEKQDVECEGFVDGNMIRFYYVRPSIEGDFIAIYSGHVGGDVMGGEVDLGEHGKTTWRATRGN